MKHALRKYISPCGSALFMVVSTMAALIVLVTAMYMSVLSSRQVQYATFDQEQAYVTSSSIGDMVYTYICENTSSSLATAVSKMNKGESVSTNGNDFKSFGGTTKDDDERLGAFDVTITYIYDEGDESVYDIAVTVENNGVFETTHDFMIIDGEEPKMRRIDNFFTATGYLPTDIWLQKAFADSTMYFDNEYVKFTKHTMGGSVDQSMYYDFDITALGTLEIDIANNIPSDKMPDSPLTWAIGKNFYVPYNNMNQNWKVIDLAGTSTQPGRIIVGGDMEFGNEGGGEIAANTEIYVFGDLYLSINNNGLRGAGKVYVKGNIYDTSSRSANTSMIYSTTGKYYYKDQEPVSLDPWGTDSNGESLEKVISEILDQKMNPSVWPRWNVTDSTNELDVHFSSNGVAFIEEDGVIKSYTAEDTNRDRFLIIDTGMDETQVRTITLSPNYTNSKGKEAFKWNPWSDANGQTFILTVGKGSLVINIPEGVVYQDCSRELFGNISWYTLLGGKVSYSSENGYVFTPGSVTDAIQNYMDNQYKLGLTLEPDDLTLKNGSTRCNGDTTKEQNIADGACEYVVKEVKLSNNSSDTRKYYTCTKHGGWYDFDDEDCTICQEIDDYYAGKCDSLCVGRINEDSFDDFYATPDGVIAMNSLSAFYNNYSNSTNNYSGKVDDYIYPNVNIFLVSNSENAHINLGKSEFQGDNVYRSAFFGYIYAPYMTFAIDGGAGDKGPLRSMGGLVVSDIILASGSGYLFAQPDVSIPGLVGKDWRKDLLQSQSDKSWRISHGGT